MVKHIVFFRVKELPNQSKVKVINSLKDRIDALKNKISAIVEFKTAKNYSKSPSAYHLVLESVFYSDDELEAYKVHPEHLKLLEYLDTVKESVAVVDYEFF